MSCFSFFRLLFLSFHSFLTPRKYTPSVSPLAFCLRENSLIYPIRLRDLSPFPSFHLSFTFHQSRLFSDEKPLGVEHVKDIQEEVLHSTAEKDQSTSLAALLQTSYLACKVAQHRKLRSNSRCDHFVAPPPERFLRPVWCVGKRPKAGDFRAEQSVFVCRPCSGRIQKKGRVGVGSGSSSGSGSIYRS